MALADAGELAVDPARAGVIFATGVGGFETLQEQVTVGIERGLRRVSPFLIPMMMGNAGAAQIAMRAGWHGPSEAVVTACASSNHAIAAAARLVSTGRCDANMTALSTSGESHPFDRRRDGFVMSEGAGALVLEDLGRARQRGARIYAEIAGAASTSDAHHITAPDPAGTGAAACMELAMEDAGLSPADIGHINAHATSTPVGDMAEALAIGKVFGDSSPPVTANKGVTGHGLGAAGSQEAVAIALSMQHRLIPPTAGYEFPDPDIHLDVVHGEPRPWDPSPTLSNSFGFGGHNGCLLIIPVSD
jgi:3-oxoacyl-[acyl-carrier-protein] synthase II